VRLSCTSGPREGETFELEGAEQWVIGRATDVEISIPDTSVSRRHAAVRQVGGRWVIEDLGSGNGTLVNGIAIAAESPLAHGDVLTLGDTELTFMAGAVTSPESTARRPNPLADSGAIVPARRPVGRSELRARRGGRPGRSEPSPDELARRKKLILIGAGVFAICLLPLGFLKYRQNQAEAERMAQAAELQAERARFGQLAQEGKSLMRERNWAEAKKRFNELVVLSPDHREAKDYLAVIEREEANQQHLDLSQKAITEGRLADAQAALVKVENTLMHQEERRLKSALDERAVDRVREARTIMASTDRSTWPQAQEILNDILAAFPEDRDARVALDDLERAMGTPDPNAPRAPRAPVRPKPWDGAVAAYVDGNLNKAISDLEACADRTAECRELLSKVRRFASLNERVDTLDAGGLGQLLQLDLEISDGRRSSLARAAGLKAANAYYRSASAAMAAAQWSRASQYTQRALRANPQHEGSQRLLTQLRAKAKDVYMEGYVIKDNNPDGARELMRQVLEMAPSGDETHTKAKRLLSTLGG
jgi:tetratricopeptide (TPR) repeat protein